MELLILLGLGALLWFGLRSKSPRVGVAGEAARVGIGCPLSLMLVMGVIVLIIMVGAMATGNCDTDAATGSPNSCMEIAFDSFEDTFGLHHHDSMADWWADPANPFR